MIALLEAAAADAPQRTAVVTPEGAPSYGELLDDARRVAAGLQRCGITRSPSSSPTPRGCSGCWPAPPWPGPNRASTSPTPTPPSYAPRRRARHDVVVTRRTTRRRILEVLRPEELLAGTPTRRRNVSTGSGSYAAPDSGHPHDRQDRRAQGARHDWRVLSRTVANVQPKPDQRWLLAYGPQQFAGVQVLLHVMASRATLVAPFPRQPKDGLQAMLTGGVTCVSATPTFWRFLLAEARSRKVQLPRWSRSPSAAKPVPRTSSTSFGASSPGPRSPRSTRRRSSAPSPRCATAGRAFRRLAVGD